MFSQAELFAKALLIEAPWFVSELKFDQNQGRLDIWIDFERGSLFYYEDASLGVKGEFKAYDTRQKTWRHLNFFQYECYLHAWVPRIELPDGKIRLVQTPWEGLSTGFTLLMEAMLMEFMKMMPVHQIGKLYGISDHKLWKMLKQYNHLARAEEDYSQVKVIGIDETAVRRGHDYVSMVVDLDEKRTIYVGEGKDQTVLARFAEDFIDHNGDPDSVVQVTCDMSPAFIRGVQDNFPNADIVFDRFHIMKIINEAVDKVRRKEVAENPILKGARYIFLKNQENLSIYQQNTLENIRISGLNLKTMKALHIREAFQQIYSALNPELFEKLLKKWYFWATHSRIEPIKQAAYTIKRHWNGVLNWIHYRISNGILEGFNSVFQAAKTKARGYQRTDSIIAIIFLLTGKIDYSKINPYLITHSK